jgi:hypothetical protein
LIFSEWMAIYGQKNSQQSREGLTAEQQEQLSWLLTQDAEALMTSMRALVLKFADIMAAAA